MKLVKIKDGRLGNGFLLTTPLLNESVYSVNDLQYYVSTVVGTTGHNFNDEFEINIQGSDLNFTGYAGEEDIDDDFDDYNFKQFLDSLIR